MKHVLLAPALAVVIALPATAASASCVAEYKAKRTNPTEYRHATMSVPADKCTAKDAQAYVRAQLASSGWTLLSIVAVNK